MTKMATMPIFGKKLKTHQKSSSLIDFKETWCEASMVKYSNVYINHDPVMTLTKFMARSTWVAFAFELGKLLKCHLKGKASRKSGKWTEY